MKRNLAGLFAVALVLVLGHLQAAAGSSGPVVGIGVGVHSVDHQSVIDQVLPGDPADKGGVKVGDRLVKINGTSVAGVPLADVAKMLQGPVGTKVRITVQRAGETGLRKFTLKRQMILLLPAQPTPP